VVNELTKLPTVGEKTALRLAYHMLTRGKKDAASLASAISEALSRLTLCQECFYFAEEHLCEVCSDPSRDTRTLCVVEKPADVLVLERSSTFTGLYHVLHGLWSPLRGVRPEHMTLDPLLSRVRRLKQETAPLREIILATSTTVEGDATALFLAQELEGLGIELSRLAQGLPKGGELEYADEVTLAHALQGRRGF
jgi:recombination protein RecR